MFEIFTFFKKNFSIALLDFPSCVIGEQPELTAETLEIGDTSTFCWRNMFSCINLLRVLNKLTKWKHSRIMVSHVFITLGLCRPCGEGITLDKISLTRNVRKWKLETIVKFLFPVIWNYRFSQTDSIWIPDFGSFCLQDIWVDLRSHTGMHGRIWTDPKISF